MLTRILVAGDDAKLAQKLQGAAKGKQVEAVSLQPGGSLPPGTVGVVTDTAGASAALDIAVALGTEQDNLLQLLANAVDCREAIPLGASDRLRKHAVRMAEVLKLSPAEQLTLERGALVRDIGKMRISNDVLLKKNVLSYDEFILLQQHTILGVEVLKDAGLFGDTLDIVQYHHECYDGTGYPDRLEKDAIPLAARIIKLLDVYCAMTSRRAYRDTVATHDQAVHHLTEERGKHFDPDLVDAFLKGKVGQPVDAQA